MILLLYLVITVKEQRRFYYMKRLKMCKVIQDTVYLTGGLYLKRIYNPFIFVSYTRRIFESMDLISCLYIVMMQAFVFYKKFLYLICRDSGTEVEVIGTCSVVDSNTLYDFGLLPEYRGLHLSKFALNTILQLFKTGETITLYVRINNKRARAIYESAGFIYQISQDKKVC